MSGHYPIVCKGCGKLVCRHCPHACAIAEAEGEEA